MKKAASFLTIQSIIIIYRYQKTRQNECQQVDTSDEYRKLARMQYNV